jgi:hypothetical protein
VKVLIVGSISRQLSDLEKQQIQDACKEIGKELAKKNVSLIVGSDNTDTVDWWVVEGAAESKRTVSVHVYRPTLSGSAGSERGNSIPFSKVENIDRYKNVRFIHHRPTYGFWDSTHAAAIKFSDAVLVISGSDGARSAGDVSVVLGKPMLPIGSFQGSSNNLWKDYRAGYQNLFSDEEERYIFHEWSKDSAKYVFPALENIRRRNPYGEQGQSVKYIMWIALISLSAWLSLFFTTLEYSEIHPNTRIIAVIILSLISAICGVCLRTSSAIMLQDSAEKNINVLIAEFVTGILLTFGFILFFFLSSAIISPDTPLLDKPADFQRVAIVTSVLGLAASFLLEQGLRNMSERLSKVIEGKLSNLSGEGRTRD